VPVPQPRAPDCIDLLKRQQCGVPPQLGVNNAMPAGFCLNYPSSAAPEFYPPSEHSILPPSYPPEFYPPSSMQSDVTFSPTRAVPPPPDQSPVIDKSPICSQGGPSPLSERTNLPEAAEHDLQEKKPNKPDPKSSVTPVKEALSAQRQELEDQIKNILAYGAATGVSVTSGDISGNAPEVTEISVEDLPEDLPSVGSVGHDMGECRRCNFFPSGHCMNGRACAFCHFTHEKRKLSRRERRERREERQKEEQENSGNAFSEVSSNRTTPTVTPSGGASMSNSSFLQQGYNSEVVTPTVTPMVTPTAGAHVVFPRVVPPNLTPMLTPTARPHAGLPMQPWPARIMCSSEAQTDDDLPACTHCGASYSESVADQPPVSEPVSEAGSPSGDGEGPPASDASEPENDENNEDKMEPWRIAVLGG